MQRKLIGQEHKIHEVKWVRKDGHHAPETYKSTIQLETGPSLNTTICKKKSHFAYDFSRRRVSP